MRENKFQRDAVQRIHREWDRPLVLKNDPNLIQGIMDLTVVLPNLVAFIEVKRSDSEPFQPNQEYYLARTEEMGHFTAVLHPGNEEEVFRALHAASGA